MMRYKSATIAGFTLLEVLIAMMILGLSITAILHQFSAALRAGSISQENTQAVIYAKQKIEELKSAREIAESSSSGSFDDGFEWETIVTEYVHPEYDSDPDTYDGLRFETFKLKSVVKWREGERERMVELITLYSVRQREWK